MSPGFQLLSIAAAVGEYSLRMAKYPLPGTVASQLPCFALWRVRAEIEIGAAVGILCRPVARAERREWLAVGEAGRQAFET